MSSPASRPRANQVEPSVLLPTDFEVESLGAEDRRVLQRLMTEPQSYIPSPLFDQPGAEQRDGRLAQRGCLFRPATGLLLAAKLVDDGRMKGAETARLGRCPEDQQVVKHCRKIPKGERRLWG